MLCTARNMELNAGWMIDLRVRGPDCRTWNMLRRRRERGGRYDQEDSTRHADHEIYPYGRCEEGVQQRVCSKEHTEGDNPLRGENRGEAERSGWLFSALLHWMTERDRKLMDGPTRKEWSPEGIHHEVPIG